MTSSPQSLAIIGAGVFGLSTALAWREAHTSAHVTLIDVKPVPSTDPIAAGKNQILPASEDIGKIIRAAYISPVYAALGREALQIWRNQKPYRDFFHASGWITANALADGDGSISTGDQMGRERFEQAFPGSCVDENYVISEDATPGWVEASRCLEAVRQEALSRGVEYCAGEAASLLWEGEKKCVGVKMRDGREIRAENVVVAAGAWTPDFLHKCSVAVDIDWKVSSVVSLGIKLDEEQYARHKDMPILLINGQGDILPPDRDRVLKINNATSFYAPDISNREIPKGDGKFFEENLRMVHDFLPGLLSTPVAFRRYCCDLVTMPSQDFIISPVPELQGLHLATGGSFHGWKFLPVIGRYVVRMIEGTLPDPWLELWRLGGTPSENPVHQEVVPKRPFV